MMPYPHARDIILLDFDPQSGHEIKKKRPQRTELLAQLARYAACERVEALLVLAPRGVDLPEKIGGKPVTMMSLEKLWGISLP